MIKIYFSIVDFFKKNEVFGAIGIFLLVLLCFFWDHLFGETVFPFDFIGGYHSMAYSFSRTLSMGEYPDWSANGTLGYPMSLSLQNSSFYPPVMFLATLGVEYTHKVAVVLQISHVFAAGMGVWYLTRLYKVNFWPGIFSSIVFMFSAALISSSQHVDIIRGAAYLPWVFLVVHPSFLKKNILRFSFLVFILYSFISGSYIGIIISTFYTGSLYVVVLLIKINKTSEVRNYLIAVISAVVISILMLSVKFLPMMFSMHEFSLKNFSLLRGRIGWENCISLIFDLKSDLIPGGITTRGLFIAPAAFVLLFFVRMKKMKKNMELVLVLVLILVLISNNFISDVFVNYFPGANLSRFYVTDYKGLMTLFLILIVSVGLSGKKGFIINRGVSLFLSIVFVSFLLILSLAYFFHVYVDYYYLLALGLTLLIPLISIRKTVEGYVFDVKRLFLLASFSVVTTSFIYWNATSNIWKFSNFYSYAIESWGFDFHDFYGHDWGYPDYIEEKPVRPLRKVYSSVNEAGVVCDYTDEYSSLSYDAGQRLKRNVNLSRMVLADSVIREFMEAPSRWIIVPDSASLLSDKLLTLDRESDQVGKVNMLHFTNQGSLFEVSCEKSQFLVENEIYYPNWKASYVDKNGKLIVIEAVESKYGFRAWGIPEGNYQLQTYFEMPYLNVSKVISFISVMGWCVIVTIGAFRCRKKLLEENYNF